MKLDISNFNAGTQYASKVKGGEPDGCTFAEPVQARYIKLVVDECITGTQCTAPHIRMYEFEIMGYEAGATNLALDATVTTTYELYNSITFPLDMINNGKKDVDGQNLANLKWKEGGEILFDLGSVCDVTGYRIYSYEWPVQYGMATKWKIYGSEDGVNYTELHEESIDTEGFTAGTQYFTVIMDGKPNGCDFAAPVKARYIKYVAEEAMKGTEAAEPRVRMYELEILGFKGE